MRKYLPEAPLRNHKLPGPYPEAEERRLKYCAEGRTFSYEQCTRLLCRRWFPDYRPLAIKQTEWCPYCLGKALHAFVNRVCRNSPSRLLDVQAVRVRLSKTRAKASGDRKIRREKGSMDSGPSYLSSTAK